MLSNEKNPILEDYIKLEYHKIHEEQRNLKALKEKLKNLKQSKGEFKFDDPNQEQKEQALISQARIICTTLSTGASRVLEKFEN